MARKRPLGVAAAYDTAPSPKRIRKATGLSQAYLRGLAVASSDSHFGFARLFARQEIPQPGKELLQIFYMSCLLNKVRGGQIDPCSWNQSKHGLCPLRDAHQAFERTRTKIRMYFDPAPARQHYCQPTPRFVLRRRLPGRQLHPHQTTGPGHWLTPSVSLDGWSNVLKLKLQLWQNLLRCSQTRPPTAEFSHGYVAWALTILFWRSSGHFNTDHACRTSVLVRRLRTMRVKLQQLVAVVPTGMKLPGA
jgi:hypothetical protein